MLRDALAPDAGAHIVLAGDFNFASCELDRTAAGGGLRAEADPDAGEWEACFPQMSEVFQPEPTHTAHRGGGIVFTAAWGCRSSSSSARARPCWGCRPRGSPSLITDRSSRGGARLGLTSPTDTTTVTTTTNPTSTSTSIIRIIITRASIGTTASACTRYSY